MYYKIKLTINILFIFLVLGLNAQNDNEEISTTLKNVAKELSQLHISKNPKLVLQYFDKNYVETEHRLYVDQSIQLIKEQYSDFEGMVNKYANTKGLSINYRVSNILTVKSKNNWGLIIAECEFDVFQDGVKEYSAKEIQTISMSKNSGTWKLVFKPNYQIY